MYSLVNVAALVRDVARLDTAPAVVSDLLHAFGLDDVDLAQLDALVYDDEAHERARDRVLVAAGAGAGALQVLAATRDVATDLGLAAYTAAADVLEHATIGSAADVHRFVRHEVLDAGWESADAIAVARRPRAITVVADAVVGSWVDNDALRAPWSAWLEHAHPTIAATEWVDAVDAVAVAGRRLDRVAAVPSTWAHHMHAACWALHVTGRLRAAAVTQLLALSQLLDAYAPGPPPMRAVATMTAAVHAIVVRDVLDATTYRAMTQPLFSLLA